MVCGMEAMHRVKGSFGDVLEVLDEENPATDPELAFILDRSHRPKVPGPRGTRPWEGQRKQSTHTDLLRGRASGSFSAGTKKSIKSDGVKSRNGNGNNPKRCGC